MVTPPLRQATWTCPYMDLIIGFFTYTLTYTFLRGEGVSRGIVTLREGLVFAGLVRGGPPGQSPPNKATPIEQIATNSSGMGCMRGLPGGQVRSEDRPGSSGTMPLLTPEPGEFFIRHGGV